MGFTSTACVYVCMYVFSFCFTTLWLACTACVCMYVVLYVCVYVHVFVYVRTWARQTTYIHVGMYVCMRMCHHYFQTAHTHTDIHTSMSTHVYTHLLHPIYALSQIIRIIPGQHPSRLSGSIHVLLRLYLLLLLLVHMPSLSPHHIPVTGTGPRIPGPVRPGHRLTDLLLILPPNIRMPVTGIPGILVPVRDSRVVCRDVRFVLNELLTRCCVLLHAVPGVDLTVAVCMYVCMCACAYICTYMHTHTCCCVPGEELTVAPCMYVCMYVCVCVCVCIYMYIYAHTYMLLCSR